MNNPSCPTAQPAFNPGALQQTVRVVSQRQMARDTYCLRLETPEIASKIVPGQFFMVRPAGGVNPLLGRPFRSSTFTEATNGRREWSSATSLSVN